MLKKWLIVFFIFAVFCGSVVTLIHANKGKNMIQRHFLM